MRVGAGCGTYLGRELPVLPGRANALTMMEALGDGWKPDLSLSWDLQPGLPPNARPIATAAPKERSESGSAVSNVRCMVLV